MTRTSHPVTVRRARPADAALLRAVRLAALTDTPEQFDAHADEVAHLDRADWEGRIRDAAVFLAETPGPGPDAGPRPVGLAVGESDAADPASVWLSGLWVDPGHRRAGVGAALTRAVIDWARTTGAAALRLHVVHDNRAARHAYEGCGFRASGEEITGAQGLRELEYVLTLSGGVHP